MTKVRAVVLIVLSATVVVGCGSDNNPVGPAPTPTPTPIATPFPTPVPSPPATQVVALLAKAPPMGTILRDGDTIHLGVAFSLPSAAAYPTSASLGLVFKNKAGTVTGLSCGTKYYSRVQSAEIIECDMRINDFSFSWPSDPQYGVAGPVDVSFYVFNWDEDRHPGEVRYYRVFDTGYIYQK